MENAKPLLGFDRYLTLLENDAERMTTVARLGLDEPVPSCPGWTVGEAVRHTGSVYHHKIACMRLQRAPNEDEFEQQPPEGTDLLAWFRTSRLALTAELTERGPDAPSYTWWPGDQTVGFWYRRMAQETAVHRADAESGHDEMTPVDPDLAVDGVDEVLERFVGGDWSELEPAEWEDVSPEAGAGGTVAVRTGDHAWRVTLHPDRVDVVTDLGPADATITAEPSELLLYLWGRRPEKAVHVEGDDGLVQAFRDRLRLATQ